MPSSQHRRDVRHSQFWFRQLRFDFSDQDFRSTRVFRVLFEVHRSNSSNQSLEYSDLSIPKMKSNPTNFLFCHFKLKCHQLSPKKRKITFQGKKKKCLKVQNYQHTQKRVFLKILTRSGGQEPREAK